MLFGIMRLRFAICLLLIICIKQNDGSWSWMKRIASIKMHPPQQTRPEASSLEELQRTDPELYQQVIATRPALLQLHNKLRTNPNLEDLKKVEPMIYEFIINKHPNLAVNVKSKRAERVSTDQKETHETNATNLLPSLAALKRVEPGLYRQLVALRPDLQEPVPRPSPTLNDLKTIDPDMYRLVVDELQTRDTDFLDILSDNEKQSNLTQYGNATRRDINSRRYGSYNKIWNYPPLMLKYYLTKWPIYVGEYMQSCYDCGYEKGIPRSPLCHDAFESPDWRARTTARYFRSKCHRNTKNDMGSYSRQKDFYFDEKIFHPSYDRGLIHRKYGLKIGGCYKRYLDVGKVYTQRGCRRWPPGPWHSNTKSTHNFATHRYRKLEYILGQAKEDKCLYSPHASLTPFHRGISLFARYHVCVCHTNFCNAAPAHTGSVQAVFAMYFMLIIVL